MADNYIERKYAEYELRKAAWLKKQKHAIKRRPSIQPVPRTDKEEKEQVETISKKP